MTDTTAILPATPTRRSTSAIAIGAAFAAAAMTSTLWLILDYQNAADTYRLAMQDSFLKNPNVKLGDWLSFPYNATGKEARIVGIERKQIYNPVPNTNIYGFDETCLTLEMPYRETNRYFIGTVDGVCSAKSLFHSPTGPDG